MDGWAGAAQPSAELDRGPAQMWPRLFRGAEAACR